MESWDKPLQLLYPGADSKLQLNHVALCKIREIASQLSVISIAGLYRTGKSFCLNRVARKLGKSSHTGFPVTPSSEALTKGIWVWYLQGDNENDGILLLDTEGLGDPVEGDLVYDYRIMCISMLLSSVFIYNACGEIDLSAIEKLKFVTDMTKKITFEGFQSRDIDHSVFFPKFILLARNFQSDFLINGQVVSEDEYMEHKMFSLNKNWKEESNDLTATMRNCFLSRKCFTLPYPCGAKNLKQLNTLPDEELDADFLSDFDKFYDYICNKEFKKKLNYIDYINGNRFALLVNQYVEQVNDLKLVLIDRATVEVARTENKNAVDASIVSYRNKMKKALHANSSLTAVLNAHGQCALAATESFIETSMEDGKSQAYQSFQKEVRECYAQNVKSVTGDGRVFVTGNDHEDLEAIKSKLAKELEHCSDGELEKVVFNNLNQVLYHKTRFAEIENKCNAIFDDNKKKCREKVQESIHGVIKEKKKELERLECEGFGNSRYYENIRHQIEQWTEIVIEVVKAAIEIWSIVRTVLGR